MSEPNWSDGLLIAADNKKDQDLDLFPPVWKGWWQFAWSDKIWSGRKWPSEFKGSHPTGCPDPTLSSGCVDLEPSVAPSPGLQLIRTPCLKLWPLGRAVRARRLDAHPDTGGLGERAMGREGEESLPTVTDHSACKEHLPSDLQKVLFHLHFKQIGGLVGHYHLECPVMGNRRKGLCAAD